MGYISETLRKSGEVSVFGQPPQSPTDRGRGRALWGQIFGTTKEDQHREEGDFRDKYRKPTSDGSGGSWGKFLPTAEASFKRLLQAMRSGAPGAWSDSRYEQSRHFTGIQYVAIHRICTQWQQAEFQVFKRDDKHPDGKRPVTKEDEPEGDRQCKPYDLVRLLERPNKQDSFGKLLYRTAQQKYLTGTALNLVVPNKLGNPHEMYTIPTAIAIPQAVVSPEYPEGFYRIQPLYPYGPFSSWPTPSTSVGAPVPAQWMMKLSYPHPLLRYEGYSPLTALKQHIDEVEGIDNSRWYSMKRGINPSAVLNFEEMEGSAPLPEPEIERIKAEFEADFQGTQNVGRLFVSTPGGRLEPWGASPRDMEYQAGWEQLVAFIMGGLGITKPAAGMIEDASYATLFATLKQLHLVTLTPDLVDAAQEFTRFLGPFFGDDLIVEIKCPRIDDHDVKRADVQTLMQGFALTKNEMRKAFDYDVTGEKWGKEMAGTPPPPPMPMGGEGGGLEALLGGLGGEGEGDPDMIEEDDEGLAGIMDGELEGMEDSDAMPGPGNMGKGSLGPRKSLRKALVNGKMKQPAKKKSVREKYHRNGVLAR